MTITTIEALAIAKALTDAAAQASLRGDKEITAAQLSDSIDRAQASVDRLRAVIDAKKASSGGGGVAA